MSGNSAAHGNPSPDAYNPSSDSYPCHSVPLLLGFVLISFFLLGFFTIYIVRYALHLLQIAARYRRRNASRIAGVGMSSALPPCDKTSTGLDPAILSSFPIFMFTAGRGVVVPSNPSIPECPVCLTEFAEGELYRLLAGCGHEFHLNCIDLWFAHHNTCPVCRLKLDSAEKPPPPHGEVYQHRDEQVVVMVEEAESQSHPSLEGGGGARTPWMSMHGR